MCVHMGSFLLYGGYVYNEFFHRIVEEFFLNIRSNKLIYKNINIYK
jgi:hypothetical protein